MKLWLILTLFGEISGTWGPLPYDMAECQSRAAAMLADIEHGIATHPATFLRGREVVHGSFATYCAELPERPVLGTTYSPPPPDQQQG